MRRGKLGSYEAAVEEVGCFGGACRVVNLVGLPFWLQSGLLGVKQLGILGGYAWKLPLLSRFDGL